jgi:hypothetical protein
VPAAVLVGESGVGPWQDQEIQGLLSQFMERRCPIIPVILPSVKTTPKLPWPLANLHRADFRESQVDPLKQLIWGITGEEPAELSQEPDSWKPVTVPETVKDHLLLREMAIERDTYDVSALRKSPRRGSVGPLLNHPIKTRRNNSKFFGTGSWSIGWRGFSSVHFTTKC